MILTDENGKRFEAVLTEIKEPEFKVGYIVHYWDGDDHRRPIGRVTKIDKTEYYYKIDNEDYWEHIAHPTTIPNIKIPFKGAECPEHLKGKTFTLWWIDVHGEERVNIYKKYKNTSWASAIAYMIHPEEE